MTAVLMPRVMNAPLKLHAPHEPAQSLSFCCPVCKQAVEAQAEQLRCRNEHCRAEFPVLDGVPILINEANSAFRIADFTQRSRTYFMPQAKPTGTWRRLRRTLARWLIPPIDHNLTSEANFNRLGKWLIEQTPTHTPRVLIVGGSVLGQGLQQLHDSGRVQFVESDVSLSPRVKVVCDGHDLPFADATFDGVIIQAVLEHVVDPYRVVEEIHRVLKPEGIVYAETPFMQQVHGGPYDFTRFTHLGHRRLFRRFEEVESGVACGPGMALAWSYKYFLTSFLSSRAPNILHTMVNIFVHWTSFWLKYFDYFLNHRPGAYDAASGYYFFGRKSNTTLSDRELIQQYRGAIV